MKLRRRVGPRSRRSKGSHRRRRNWERCTAKVAAWIADPARAVVWWRVAAEPGLASAQLQVGLVYAKGRGVDAEAEQALAWLRAAALVELNATDRG